MGTAHSGNHDIAFFEAAIEETLGAVAGTGALTSVNTDDDGPLRAGRYLVQAVGISGSQVVWVHVGKYVVGTPLTPAAPTAPGLKRFPLTSAVAGVETHCLGGYSDRMAVQVSSGSSVQVYVSRVSNEVRKSGTRA